MVIIFIFAILVYIVIIYRRRDWAYPSALFVGVWAFILLLYSLQIFRILPPTPEIIAVLAVMLVAFALGSATFSLAGFERVPRKPRATAALFADLRQIREILFFVLCAISAVVMLVDQFQIIRSVLAGASFSDVMRAAEGKGTVEISGPVRVTLYMFIVHPITACISPICAVEVLTRKNGRLRYLIANIIIVFLAVFHHGGRNAIIVMGISYLVAYAILKSGRIAVSRKAKVSFVVFGVLGIISVFSLSSSRGIQDIWLSFYAYFIADIPLGQQYLQASHFIIDHTWGFFSFQGFFYPLYSVLGFFGISPSHLYEMSTIMSDYIEANYLPIGNYSVTGSNAFLPAGAYPYVDGGYIFEFIFMFVYGYASAYLYKKQRFGGPKDKALYVFWAYALVLSFCRLYFTSYSYFVGMLLIIFVLYRGSGEHRVRLGREQSSEKKVS